MASILLVCFSCDQQHSSDAKLQQFDISQGCLLYPMLFEMIMSVLTHEARKDPIDAIGDEAENVHEIPSADDTLIADKT